MKKLIIATILSALTLFAEDAPKPTPPADPLKDLRESLLRIQRDFMIAKADVDATPEGQRLVVAGKNM